MINSSSKKNAGSVVGRRLVAHVVPDLESTWLTFVPKEYPLFAEVMDVDPKKATKFIPSGPLRLADWEQLLEVHDVKSRYAPMFESGEITGLTHIEPLGFCMVDCGRGTYDQHGRKENAEENRLTSWDLLRMDVGDAVLAMEFPWLVPLAEIISENDRSAEKVADDPGRAKSGCPNTARTLRSLIQGLNMAFPDEPSVVEETMHEFFRCMVEGAKRLIDEKCGREGAHRTIEGLQEAIDNGADFTQLFHLDFYLDLVEKEARTIPGMTEVPFKDMTLGDLRAYVEEATVVLTEWRAVVHPFDENTVVHATQAVRAKKTAAKKIAAFHAEQGLEPIGWDADQLQEFLDDVIGAVALFDMVNLAMEAMEEDWAEAHRDYWSKDTLIFTTMLVKRRQGEKSQTGHMVTVVVGKSDAERFGAVTRLGNFGKRKRSKDRPDRKPADITVQIRSDGRASIATRGVRIEHVAAVLRQLDLRKKGVEITKGVRSKLTRPGNLRFRNAEGVWVSTLYLPEYREGTGNAFRTNPYADPILLTAAEVKDYTVLALGGYTFMEAKRELESRTGDGAKEDGAHGRRRRGRRGGSSRKIAHGGGSGFGVFSVDVD